MGYYENGLERIAAVCVGSASVAFGMLPQGTIETSIGLAGLAGFVLGNSQKFGNECARVRRSIQQETLANYGAFIEAEGADWSLKSDLFFADQALQDCLGECLIDRAKLANSAVSPKGFPEQSILVVLSGLGERRPDLFGKGKEGTLSYRYAYDVIKAGIQASVDNVEYYRQLEPKLMYEMAQALGEIREDVKGIKQSVDEIKDDYRNEIVHLTGALHGSETEMVSLLSFILEKRIARETIISEVENAYQKLTELRGSISDLKSLSSDAPEIMPLLDEADKALSEGAGFSFDDAESALRQADEQYVEIIAEREQQVKRDKENRAKILGKRAQVAAIKLQYGEVENLYRQQLVSLMESVGEDHPDAAQSYNNLAGNLYAQGKYEVASPFYEKSLEIKERLLGDDHPETAAGYNNLALNLNAQGKYEAASPLYQKSLEIKERVLGEDHLETAVSYNNLALNLNSQGEYETAEPLYQKSLEIRERVLGTDHPDTAASYNNLALNLDAQGEFSAAAPLYQRSLEIIERVLGKNHPHTAANYNNLALNLDSQGEYLKAAPLYERSLEIFERVLGAEHPHTAIGYNNLAGNLNGLKEFKMAFEYANKSIRILQKSLGQDHLLYGRFLSRRAEAECGLERREQAEETISKAVTCLRELVAENHRWLRDALEIERKVMGNN